MKGFNRFFVVSFLGIVHCFSFSKKDTPGTNHYVSVTKTKKQPHNKLLNKKNLFNPVTHHLKNGLQVVFVQNSLVSSVAVSVCYKYGTADDSWDLVGMAHYLEHMMFKGSKHFPGDILSKTIMRSGGYVNAWTEWDQTVYHEVVPLELLEFVLKVEADRMHALSFTKKEVESERNVVLQERLMRMDNHPMGKAWEFSLKANFLCHPYQFPPIGYPHHINSYTYETLKKAYDTWYAPNNAVLIISGNFDQSKTFALIKRFFENIPKKNIPTRLRSKEPNHDGTCVHITQENKRNSLVMLSWDYQAPHHLSNPKDPYKTTYYALYLLSQIIAGDQTKELHRILVDEKKLAIDVTCSYEGNHLDPMVFSINITAPNQKNIAEIEKTLNQYIQKITQNITDDDLYKAKRGVLGSLVFQGDNVMDAVMHFSQMTLGWNEEDLDKTIEHIKRIKTSDVLKVAKMVLLHNPSCKMTIYPSKNVSEPVKNA